MSVRVPIAGWVPAAIGRLRSAVTRRDRTPQEAAGDAAGELIARRVVAVTALIGALAIGAWLWHLAGVQRVTLVAVSGEFEHLSRSAVQRAIGSLVDVPMLELDVERVHAAAASLPWVRKVSVQRHWPDRVTLNIVERRAVAVWNADRLLDADGEVFEPALDLERLPPALASLPRLYGPNGREGEVLARLRQLDNDLDAAELGRVEELRTNERRTWMAVLESGMRVRFGQTGADDGRAGAARLRVLGRMLAGTDVVVTSADLRYSNGFALRFADTSSMKVAAVNGSSAVGRTIERETR